MLKMKQFLVSMLMLFIAPLALAQNASDALAEKLNALQSMQAHFDQQILDGKGQVIQKSSGKFALLRPGKFRWETEQPAKQLLIADGSKIWVYDQDLQQVTVQKQDNHDANSPAMLLSGSVATLKKNFQVKFVKKPATEGVWFGLKPVNKSAMFQSVELNFNDNTLQAMRLIDNLGQASILKFTNVVSNPSIASNQFTFNAPKGVDIIDQTQAD